MSELVCNCPRCGTAKITFDLRASIKVGYRYNWQNQYEAFCVCRNCHKATIFVLTDRGINERDIANAQGGLSSVKSAVNNFADVSGFINTKDRSSRTPPDYLTPGVLSVFQEAATCLSVQCFNACGTMCRLCIDLVTKGLLPHRRSVRGSTIRRGGI